MPKTSAGLLMYRTKSGKPEIFLVHPGGPFWKNKDEGSWSIPKGEIEENENPLEAAKREFEEETGIKPIGDFFSIGEVKQKSGKIVHAWIFEGDSQGFLMKQNIIEIEFPYGSGKRIKIPEVDKVSFFKLEESKKKIVSYQKEFIERLEIILNRN